MLKELHTLKHYHIIILDPHHEVTQYQADANRVTVKSYQK